ncbi:unnamed protein product [Mytilus coruscus]|uniref:Uncharacterized protein n=1 Tax=Mytilus coruscus TaxID=42192 RepID=A0A6J8CC25_MYTCO|nr:unnamed protein product [Mytilus coruscus]
MDVSQVTITKMQKLVRAEMFGRRQLTVLNIKLNEINKRLKICKDRGVNSHLYVLKQRRKVTENVRNMYGIYVRRKMTAVARMIITNFSNSVFESSNSSSDSQNNDETENLNSPRSDDVDVNTSEDTNISTDSSSNDTESAQQDISVNVNSEQTGQQQYSDDTEASNQNTLTSSE